MARWIANSYTTRSRNLDIIANGYTKRLIKLGTYDPGNILFFWSTWGKNGLIQGKKNIDKALRIFSCLLENFGRDHGLILKQVVSSPSSEFTKFLIVNYGSHLTQNDLKDTLIEAVRYGNLDNVNLLLESGANNYDETLSSMFKRAGARITLLFLMFVNIKNIECFL